MGPFDGRVTKVRIVPDSPKVTQIVRVRTINVHELRLMSRTFRRYTRETALDDVFCDLYRFRNVMSFWWYIMIVMFYLFVVCLFTHLLTYLPTILFTYLTIYLN